MSTKAKPLFQLKPLDATTFHCYLRCSTNAPTHTLPAEPPFDRDQVLWARDTEHPTQPLVFTRTAGRHNLVEVIVI